MKAKDIEVGEVYRLKGHGRPYKVLAKDYTNQGQMTRPGVAVVLNGRSKPVLYAPYGKVRELWAEHQAKEEEWRARWRKRDANKHAVMQRWPEAKALVERVFGDGVSLYPDHGTHGVEICIRSPEAMDRLIDVLKPWKGRAG